MSAVELDGGTFMMPRRERDERQEQKSLSNKLRKNPHPSERPPAKSFARMGVRTIGFFCGRLKRLALSSRAARRGVLGRRRRETIDTMAASKHTAVDSQQHSPQTDDVTLSAMQCPTDGTQLSDVHRDGSRVECPTCQTRWPRAQVVVTDV